MAKCDETRISEKRYYTIAPQPLTVDGTTKGIIEVANTFCWKVGMCVTVVSDTVAPRKVKIKAVLSETEIMIGDITTPIYAGQDVSDLTVVDNAMIGLPEDHENNKRPVIHLNEIYRQVYEEEPTVAIRSHLVDWLGRSYCQTNPLPVKVDGITIDNISVQLTHLDNDPNAGDVHDSVRIGDGTDQLKINADGSINIKVNPATTPKVTRIATGAANTEQSYAFTTVTKRFKFRVENSVAKARIAFAAGDTADGGDYWTVNRGSYYEDRDLDLSAGVTLYFRVNKANQTVQIQYWE